MAKLTVGSCFSGIGGLELGLEWTGGFETKWQIENDKYASRILAKNWPSVQRFSDIRDVVRPPAVDVICGGFPCQDVSLAGARAGLEGKRSTLWGEMFRLVCEVKPRWVVAENVPGLFSSDAGRFFGNILRDLASAGYDAEWGVLSAAGVGAPHLRKRVFIVAHSDRERELQSQGSIEEIGERLSLGDKDVSDAQGVGRVERDSKPRGLRERTHSSGAARRGFADGRAICDSSVEGFQNGREASMGERGAESKLERSDWWTTEPKVGRVAHGIPSRVDRLRCLGNSVVPQVAQKVGEMILANLSKALCLLLMPSLVFAQAPKDWIDDLPPPEYINVGRGSISRRYYGTQTLAPKPLNFKEVVLRIENGSDEVVIEELEAMGYKDIVIWKKAKEQLHPNRSIYYWLGGLMAFSVWWFWIPVFEWLFKTVVAK